MSNIMLWTPGVFCPQVKVWGALG